ncbi:MAG: FtsQ-type POTRA domain-containing protein [Christensenellaceae bacterium]|nr:FtsQ-type POTRA domain-containing protein [Christensenellaceae bacterium]MEA5069083.1 FtsQ-type POTRA domain-containing protein [Christensenellaceae bacterium]
MAASRRYRSGRRRAGPSGLVLGLVFVLAAGFVVSRVFVVRRVAVSGNERVGDQQIVELSGILPGRSIFTVDRAAVARAFEREGNVALTDVEVVWPDTVRLSVRERTRAAVVNHLGMSIAVDEAGVVIEVLRSLPEGALPVVTGLSATGYQPGRQVRSSVPTQVDAMASVLGAARSQGLTELISELNVSDLDNLYLMTRAGMMVKLGDAASMDAKLMWMQSALNSLTAEGASSGTINVASGKDAIYSAP